MSAPKASRTTSRGRLYEWRRPDLPLDQEVERFWSVTTIIKGGTPAPALQAWGMKAVAEFAVANYRQLGAMVGSSYRFERDPKGAIVGILDDPDAAQSAIDWLKGAPYRERDRKADLGTAVHDQAEAYVLGKPMPEPDPSIAANVQGFRNFLEDYQPEYARLDGGMWLAEASVFNRPEQYAGTLDAIADVPGLGRVLIDYKTGKDIYAETALQLAAYRHAEFIGLPDGTEWPMPEVDGCAALHLSPLAGPRGYALRPVIADDRVFLSFKYVRETFRWMEETSKGVIGAPLSPPKREAVAA